MWRELAPFLLLVALPGALQAAPPERADLVGTWELERVDGVAPADAPPAGYRNLVVQFSADGRLRYGYPGDASGAATGPYSLRNGELHGSMGLSNDLDSPRKVETPAKGWLELTFPDGFVATFRKADESREITPHCVFFTVAGRDYDPDQVRRFKDGMFHFRPEPVPSELQGVWQAQMGQSGEGAVALRLEIDSASARFVLRSVEPVEETLLDDKEPLEVSGDLLRSRALSCGAVQQFSVVNGVLELRANTERPLRLGRQE